MAQLQLSGKHAVGRYAFTIVDDDALVFLSRWKWKPKRSAGDMVYVSRDTWRNGKRVTIRLHRVVCGVAEAGVSVDHRNHDTMDNRRENLVCGTQSANLKNSQRREAKGICHRCAEPFTRVVSSLGGRTRKIKYCGSCAAVTRTSRHAWTHGAPQW